MNQCPTCNRTYEDTTLRYCLDDGSALIAAYDPHATQSVTLPRATNAPTEVLHVDPPRPHTSKRKSNSAVYILIALLVVAIVGGAVAILVLAYKSDSPKTPGTTIGSNNENTKPSVAENTSAADRLVGAWRANVVENGNEFEINYTANADGSSSYYIIDEAGQSVTSNGTWRYSDGILYEKFSDGASGKSSIQWIDSDTFDLTIIDNGTPADNGIKRRYHRVT